MYNFHHRGYGRYFLDVCAGGGWSPPYEGYTEVSPNFRFVKPISNSPIWVGNAQRYQLHYYQHERYSDRIPAFFFDIQADILTNMKATTVHSTSPSFCCFRLALSERDDISPTQMEHFWTYLQHLSSHVSFEIVGNGNAHTVGFQFLCHSDCKTIVANQLSTLFPNSTINLEGTDNDLLTEQIGGDTSERFRSDFDACGLSFGLAGHYAFPLRTFSSFTKTDPLSLLVDSLSDLANDEGAVIQALISPFADTDWLTHFNSIEEGEKRTRYVSGYDPYRKHPMTQKRRFPMFAVCFRVMAFGKKGTSGVSKFQSIPSGVEKALIAMKLPDTNVLMAQPPEEPSSYPKTAPIIPEKYQQTQPNVSSKELQSVLARQTYRHGFLLNSQELATLCHFPSKALQHPKLLRQNSMMAKAPESVTQGNGLLLGVNEVFGQSQEVYIPEDFRFRHLYVVGKTGTGKTTFLFNLLKADIDAGKGVGLIDPHGDLVEQVLRVIPEHRIDDVILFDPSDYEYPIGFNIMEVRSLQERRQIRNDILVAIRRLFEDSSWGDNIDQLFRTAIATLLADYQHTYTLMDIRRLLSDDVFRSQVLKRIDDDYLEEFWRDDFSEFPKTTISALRRRLGSILSEPEVRNVLAQPQTSFDFNKMMDTNKIFLAKISRGTLGEDISHLFGGLLVSKIQLTAMSREAQPEHQRVPFYLYVDEFQNFVNEGFEFILSEARKYKLCLTMAHQFTAQLPTPLYKAVFGNVGSLVTFELGVDDATALEKQLGKFSAEDILNLEDFHTITRIGKAKDAFSMKTLPPSEESQDFSEQITSTLSH